MESIITLISNVGFPIAACVVLFIQNSKFNEALAENTLALNKLVERIERLDNEGGRHNDD